MIGQDFNQDALASAECVLTIEPGPRCGVAFGTVGAMVCGEWNLKARQWKGYGFRWALLSKLEQTHRQVRLNAIVCCNRANQSRLADLEEWCTENSVPLVLVTRGQYKKAFTGHGNASKRGIANEAARRGLDLGTDVEAQACAMLHWAFVKNRPFPAD